MPYGYLGQNQPNQTVSNSGVFSITDVAELQSQGKLGGSLELIEEIDQTVSVSTIEFTNLGNYDVHLLQYAEVQGGSAELQARLSNDGGSSYISSSNYQYAMVFGQAGGSFGDRNSTSETKFVRLAKTGNNTGNTGQGYTYFYNLLNSSKYSFSTTQNTSMDNNPYYIMQFGGQVLAVAETHNAIQIFQSTGTLRGNFKLYGVKQI